VPTALLHATDATLNDAVYPLTQAIKLLIPLLSDVFIHASVTFDESDFLQDAPKLPSAQRNNGKGRNAPSPTPGKKSADLPGPETAPRKLTNSEAAHVERQFLSVRCCHKGTSRADIQPSLTLTDLRR